MRNTSALLALVFLAGSVACDGGPIDEPDAGPTGRPCTVQEDCWSCATCSPQYAEVCVAGYCEAAGPEDDQGELVTGSWLAVISLPSRGALVRNDVQSAAVRVYHREATDGRQVTCADLLQAPVDADQDETLNVLRTLQPTLNLNEGDGVAEIGVGSLPLGEGRIALVRLHRERQGQGTLLAVGCSEELVVDEEAGQQVLVEVDQP